VFVRWAFFAPGDSASTASAISANEALWRWGIAVHLLYLLSGAAVGVILYRLFKPPSPIPPAGILGTRCCARQTGVILRRRREANSPAGNLRKSLQLLSDP
jgi:hypothetical protein